ncbi:MAG: cbb3-type cytochrome c oxidase subunit I [Alphaproteobacteria bacterium]
MQLQLINFHTNDLFKEKLFKSWLKLAISALAFAGLLSILIVALRTPGVEKFIPYRDFFRTALVVHVDLSVLIWMISISSVFSQTIIKQEYCIFSKVAFYSSFFGTILIAASPFIMDGNPEMNNYIPVLKNIIFFIGLGLFICGSLIQIIAAILSFNYSKFSEVNYLAVYTTNIINFIAILSFFIAAFKLSNLDYPIDDNYFYELIFWAMGHILQFSYVNLMMIAWLVIIGNISNVKYIFILNLLIVIPTLIILSIYDIDSIEYKEFYTIHMRYFGGIAPGILGIIVIYNIFKNKIFNAPLINSIILFFIGGAIGTIITASNVTIPAHYHGSIVGVTLALMGASYKAIEQIYNAQIAKKWINIQAYCYGIGQLVHISGLAWSGGYGALRKTPGAEFSMKAKFGMGLMGFGGLLAIIGGLIFVIICTKLVAKNKNTKVIY